MPKKPGSVALKILEVLKRHPEGLTISQIREQIPEAHGAQEQLGRRRRELEPFYIIEKIIKGRDHLYKYVGPRPRGRWEYEDISKTQRARILYRSGSRCQMCGRTPEADKVKLHVDHRIPQSWGGSSEDENLWILCSACNEGKKAYFATFQESVMKAIIAEKSVHIRIAELLHVKQGKWVEGDLIEFVANATERHVDWQKRLRDLRYLGLKIKADRKKVGRRSISRYMLNNWVALPNNVAKVISEYERKRAATNKNRRRAR